MHEVSEFQIACFSPLPQCAEVSWISHIGPTSSDMYKRLWSYCPFHLRYSASWLIGNSRGPLTKLLGGTSNLLKPFSQQTSLPFSIILFTKSPFSPFIMCTKLFYTWITPLFLITLFTRSCTIKPVFCLITLHLSSVPMEKLSDLHNVMDSIGAKFSSSLCRLCQVISRNPTLQSINTIMQWIYMIL